VALFTNLKYEDVMSAKDVNNIYEIPLTFKKEGLGTSILKKLKLEKKIDKVFLKLKELVDVEEMGHTMRLGEISCILKKGTLCHKIYKEEKIFERHRHRFEFNPEFENILRENGMVISGKNPDRNLVEMIELQDHPWFIGCQFHPEFKSKPLKPHPLFVSFIKAAKELSRGKSS
jgi:CTP synthase